MAEINQFGSAKPSSAQMCAQCEALLMDVLDHTASPADQAFFDRHLASCTGCSRMFVDAKRGEAWLEMLRDPRPEPASSLYERIIAQTSGLQAKAPLHNAAVQAADLDSADLIASLHAVRPSAAPPAPSPFLYGAPVTRPQVFPGAKVLPFRVQRVVHSIQHTMLQPRLAMTAAMAFFSIALTLNLTGVHVSELKASDLKPSNIRKGIYQANAHVVRYCDNLRVVYELEARAHDLQRSSDSDTAQPDSGKAPADPKADPKQPIPPAEKDQKAPAKPGPGTSRREPLAPDSRMVADLRGSPAKEEFTAAHFPVYHRGACAAAMHTKGDLA